MLNFRGHACCVDRALHVAIESSWADPVCNTSSSLTLGWHESTREIMAYSPPDLSPEWDAEIYRPGGQHLDGLYLAHNRRVYRSENEHHK